LKNKKNRPDTKPSSLGKRTGFLLITILFPFGILILLEISLRVANYGGDISLFTTESLAGHTYHVMNAAAKRRYFPSVPFNPSTSPDYFDVPKPKGTYRIFCLGGSTTVGYPYWYNGSFSSFLRDRLRNIFPEKNIEVINVGMTATNSFTVNDMARELVDYEPDLFIVYDGHNEFYGALGVASHESIGRSRWLTKAYLRLIHLKTFRLLQDAVIAATRLLNKNATPVAGSTMMEKLATGQFIPLGSDLYTDGLFAYKANLDELASIALRAGVPVLMGSQLSNLRDLPPFISEDPVSQAGFANHAEFLTAYDLGVEYLAKERIDSALSAFTAASALDTIRADAHYEIARCLDTLGRKTDANMEYLKARDLDMLRFRMSSDFNNAMKVACEKHNMIFVDMERAFRSHSPDSIVGKELIVEHLHPNSKGYFILAHAYAVAMRQHRLVSSQEEWANRDTVSDEELWNDRCITEMDEMIAHRRTDILTSGWPFKTQTPIVDAVSATDTLGQIAEFVTRAQWNWQQAHNAAADYYLGRQEWEKGIREYLTLINQLPLLGVQPYLKAARLYLNQGKLNEAKHLLQASLTIQPTILAYRALGDICLQQNAPHDAIPYYEKTLAFSTSATERVENGYLLALACTQALQNQRAVSELLTVLNIKSDYQPAAALLAKLNEKK